MGQHDWYRNTTWTEDIKSAFFGRLDRSRGDSSKAQYLRIQAYYLEETGNKELVLEALNLLDMMFKSHPDTTEFAIAHVQKARCFELLGNFESAVNAYREGIEAERMYPNSRANAGLYFAWFVVRHKLKEIYDEALKILAVHEIGLSFPIEQFKFFSALAIIAFHMKRIDEAQKCAQKALKAMAKKESPFCNHKKLGLVSEPDKDIVETLTKIAHNTG